MGCYLFPQFDYSFVPPLSLCVSTKLNATSLTILFDDGNVRGQPIILGGLITVIVVHCGYLSDISNVVAVRLRFALIT